MKSITTSIRLAKSNGDILVRVKHVMFNWCNSILVALVLSLTSNLASATPKPEPAIKDTSVSEENLVEAAHGFFDKVFLSQNANLKAYRKVFVEPAEVTFSKYWEREHRTDVSRSYQATIKEKYGKLLQEELKKAYAKDDQHEIVEDINSADLVIKPMLENLNIFAPENATTITKEFVYRAGNATLNLVMVDRESNTAIAKFVDHRETREAPGLTLERANRGTNYRDFKQLMKKWSKEVVEYIEEYQAALK